MLRKALTVGVGYSAVFAALTLSVPYVQRSAFA